ncbi:MAG: MbcA/ParS/Xre antitoxin family protein [Sphingomonadaceae bacterium]|nr:MbcA/ParS/Xre antitoxin family protein [Sphingomonadaceae bacterium]
MAGPTHLSTRPQGATSGDLSRVLTEAVRRIAEAWNLTNAQLGAVIGLSGPTVSRLRSNRDWQLEPDSKPFELAAYLARLFRSLDSLAGSNDEWSRHWLTTENSDLRARPIDMLSRIGGLIEVCDYVDAFRART